MRISIVIPALNEEKYLHDLLRSIKAQTFKDYEVIVADAGSDDKTRQVARSMGARVVRGGSPARGRNAGANVAKGEFLYFLDSDIKISKHFLAKTVQEMDQRYLELATCKLVPLSNLKVDRLLHNIANSAVKIQQYTDEPVAPGCCILVSRRLFERVGGFDESLKLSEDHDFVKRASRFRQLRLLKTAKVQVSVRRLRKEGRIGLSWKYLQVLLYTSVKGKVRDEIVTYEFSNFRKNDGRIEKGLIKLDRQLSALSKEYSVLLADPKKSKTAQAWYRQLGKFKDSLRHLLRSQ
jgi:glycosyltransferase involved in cell wall biosynthesis